jgi:hypothetical protein
MKYLPLAVVGAFVAGAAAAFGVVTGTVPQRVLSLRSDRPAVAQAAASAPLELLALEHDRDEGRFIVRGIVRNSTGAAIDGLTAVISVFGHDGGLIASERGALAVDTLAAGTETPFMVILPDAGDVDRYHLSFRTAAGIVPHLDRRARGVMAQHP